MSELLEWPRRVALTYPYALGTHSGGSLALFEIARGLSERGLDVAVLPVSTARWTRFPRRPLDGELLGAERIEALQSAGVEVIRVDPHPLSQWLEHRSVARAIEHLCERWKPDVVLGFHKEAAAVPRLAERYGFAFGVVALWQSYRRIVEARPWQGRPGGPLRRLASRRVLVEPFRRADVVFATSEFTRRELVDVVGVDPRRVGVCWLGVDSDFARVSRETREVVRRLVFFGRLVPAKGCFDALEALARLERRDWVFHMMGSGEDVAVRRRAIELGIADRVVVMPNKTRDELELELAWADLALMPSHSESFGLSIAEAQAAGLPVVAYEAGSVPEIVTDGVSGWLAPLGDVDRLSELLERAMDDPRGAELAGRAGRERIGASFTWAKTCDRILEGLRELGGRREGGSR